MIRIPRDIFEETKNKNNSQHFERKRPNSIYYLCGMRINNQMSNFVWHFNMNSISLKVFRVANWLYVCFTNKLLVNDLVLRIDCANAIFLSLFLSMCYSSKCLCLSKAIRSKNNWIHSLEKYGIKLQYIWQLKVTKTIPIVAQLENYFAYELKEKNTFELERLRRTKTHT